MSMSEVKEFLVALQKDSEAKEALKQQPKPASDEEVIAAYVGLAEKMGFHITAEEMANGLKDFEAERKLAAKQAADSVKSALGEAELENVSGGVWGCESTHWDGEWCWISDSCSVLITSYDAPPVPTKMEYTDKEDGNLHTAPVPGDELTGDTIYTQAYNGCEMFAVDQLRLARMKDGFFDYGDR